MEHDLIIDTKKVHLAAEGDWEGLCGASGPDVWLVENAKSEALKSGKYRLCKDCTAVLDKRS